MTRGRPYLGVTIGMATFVRWESGEGFGKDVHDGPKGVTDSGGRVTLSYPSLKGDFGYRVRDVENYYRHTGQDYRFNVANEGRWEPWNPTVVVILKPVINLSRCVHANSALKSRQSVRRWDLI